MNSRKCKELIKQEIEWCENHRLDRKVSAQYRMGFTAGLGQALFLIRQAEKVREIHAIIQKSARRKKLA